MRKLALQPPYSKAQARFEHKSRQMDYRPRYAQPFTLEQAVHLDVPIISEGA